MDSLIKQFKQTSQLAGGNAAMGRLGTCLSEKWASAAPSTNQGQGGPIEEEPLDGAEPDEEAVPI